MLENVELYLHTFLKYSTHVFQEINSILFHRLRALKGQQNDGNKNPVITCILVLWTNLIM